MKKIAKVLILSTSIIVGTATIPIMPLDNIKAEASSTTKFTKTYYNTTSKLNLYSGAGTKYKTILSIPKGKQITATEKKGIWYKVSYTYKSKGQNITKIGWVSGRFLKEYYQYSTITNSYFITKTEAKLYLSPDTKKKYVVTVASNKQFKSLQKIVNSKGEIWYCISLENQLLYINSKVGSLKQYVSKTSIPNTTFVTISKQNLYKEPDKSSKVVDSIPNSKIVVASVKTSNEWYKVNYASKTGYVPIHSLKQVETGDPLTNRDSYQFIDLRTQSPVTAQEINNYIEENYKKHGQKSVLSGKGQAFLDAGNKYGVNALYLAAQAIHESAFGTSEISKEKNNLFGFGSYDASPFIASYRFSSIDENINYIAQLIKATYLNPGNWRYKGAFLGFSTKDMSNNRLDTNSEGMNFNYASDPYWGKEITRHMENILPYDPAYYSRATVNTTVPSLPDIPQGSDFFPPGIQAIAIKDLILTSSKGKQDAIVTLKKGSTFSLLEKTNDNWVKVMFENNTYWTKSIDFAKYKTYISVQNLGRSNIDSLNVRKDTTIPKAEQPKVLIGYVQDFHDPNEVNYSKMTHVIFSFVHPTMDGNLLFNEKYKKNLRVMVSKAHKQDVKIMLAVGGWEHIQGGKSHTYFKEAITDPTSRTKLINNLVSIADVENLDGIDIDYEYPNSKEEAQNLGTFAKILSDKLHDRDKELSMAVYAKVHSVTGTEDNSVVYEPSMFSHVDYVNVMAYDGQWDGIYNAANFSPYLYTENIVNYWSSLFDAYHLSKEKLVLGVPLYAQPENPYQQQISYSDIIKNNPENTKRDIVTINGTTYYYNGVSTVQKKTELALSHDFGGMMLWEAGKDADGTYSLTSVILKNYSNVITTLNLNDYVQFMLNKDGQIIMDRSKKWYQIKLADGTTGWVSSIHIVRELF